MFINGVAAAAAVVVLLRDSEMGWHCIAHAEDDSFAHGTVLLYWWVVAQILRPFLLVSRHLFDIRLPH